MVSTLLPLIPKHRIYVEAFGGAGALLFAKPRSAVEVYNDIDSGLVNLYRVLRDPESFQQLYKKAVLTPYSREEFYTMRETWSQTEDPVERAYRYYVVARMSFAGIFGNSWALWVAQSSRGISGATRSYLSALERLPEIHQRLSVVQIEHLDFRRIFQIYDSPETFFYLDPPYVPETRRAGEYAHEMSLEDHRELVGILLKIQGRALLSGYQHEVYGPLEEAGWARVDMITNCSVVGRTRATGLQGRGSLIHKQRRTESLWFNYAPPVAALRKLSQLLGNPNTGPGAAPGGNAGNGVHASAPAAGGV